MNEPCILHKENPSHCPQAHVCICGLPLSEHHSTGAYCRNGQQFYPNQETLDRFPDQYPNPADIEAQP